MNFEEKIFFFGVESKNHEEEELEDFYYGPDSVDYYDYDALDRLRDLRSNQKFALITKARTRDAGFGFCIS